MYYRSLYAVIAGCLLGVMIRSFFVISPPIIALAALVAFACAMLFMLDRRRVVFGMTALFCCAVCVGVVRYASVDMHSGDEMLAQYVGASVELVGVVDDEPDMRDTYVGITLDVVNAHDRVLVRMPRYPAVAYGETVTVKGILAYPSQIESDDGRTFDYVSYLKKDGIHFVMSYPSVTIIKKAKDSTGFSLYTALFDLKHRFLVALQTLLPEPEVSLLGGLVVGAKQQLGTQLLDTFRAAGVVHMVVLSGYNVSVVVRAVTCVLEFLPRILLFGSGSVCIVLFVLLTGASASIVRAGIMALLVLFADTVGRRYDVVRALAITACAMVLYNPYILVFDPSFQLSCLATVGLIYGASLVERWVRYVPTMFGLRDALASTLAAELFVLPMLLFQTGQLSLIAPLTNMLVLPTVPLVMGTGFVTGIVGMISYTAALPFAILSYALLHYELFIIEKTGTLPFASVHVPAFAWWLVVVGYAVIVLLLCVRLRRQNETQPATS